MNHIDPEVLLAPPDHKLGYCLVADPKTERTPARASDDCSSFVMSEPQAVDPAILFPSALVHCFVGYEPGSGLVDPDLVWHLPFLPVDWAVPSTKKILGLYFKERKQFFRSIFLLILLDR